MFGLDWRAVVSAGALGGLLALATSAHAVDMPLKAPVKPGCTQAVDGWNGKVAADGGTYNDKAFYGGEGSLSVPLGCEFGFQLDTSGGSFDSSSIFSVGGHLFWRNPNIGLLGLYGSYSRWDQFTGVTANHIGPEAEWYFGRWTVEGVAGVEFGNSASGQIGPSIVTYDIATRFFDQINLAYYLNDNLKVFLGHRYLGGKNAVAIGGEWGVPVGAGTMGSLFVEGRYGEDNATGVWGGIRFYFGQKDKSLIQRHREDDPVNWNPPAVPNTGSSTPAPVPKTCCPHITSLELEPGMKLAELLMAGLPPCCQNFGLILAPGAQLAENVATENTEMANNCGCPT
jgi:hypothetical protein